MKNRTLKVIIAALLVVLGIYIYSFPPQFEEDNENTICMDYSAEKMNTLSSGLIHEIVNEYKDRQLRYINSSDNTVTNQSQTPPISKWTDAENIWFDLETLKRFIYHLEVKTKSLEDTISSEDLGLRIYYASYPTTIDPKDPELGDLALLGYEKKHTLVAIPTKRIAGKNVDFNPLDFNTYALGLKATGEYDYTDIDDTYNLRNPKEVAGFGPTKEYDPEETDVPIGAQNHGGLRPPPPLGSEGNF